MMRDSWSEADILAIGAEEPDVWERKSGQLFAIQDNFLNAVAKALSALANSGGGSLILGVEDNGTVDGLPSHVGNATIRDWLEQKVPNLLEYPLSNFRVHTVQREASNSTFPAGKDVVVIDVGDSAAAPHQSVRDKVYYHRQAGRSVPARHFYLELLRNRLTAPVLKGELQAILPNFVAAHGHGLYFVVVADFLIENVGRIAAHEWDVFIKGLSHPEDGFFKQTGFTISLRNFPVPYPGGGITLPSSILPGATFLARKTFGFEVDFNLGNPRGELTMNLLYLFRRMSIRFQIATEVSPGEIQEESIIKKMQIGAFVDQAKQTLPEAFSD